MEDLDGPEFIQELVSEIREGKVSVQSDRSLFSLESDSVE